MLNTSFHCEPIICEILHSCMSNAHSEPSHVLRSSTDGSWADSIPHDYIHIYIYTKHHSVGHFLQWNAIVAPWSLVLVSLECYFYMYFFSFFNQEKCIDSFQ